jgi:hypothetical protein
MCEREEQALHLGPLNILGGQWFGEGGGVDGASSVCGQKNSKFLCPAGKNPWQDTWV